MSPVLRGDGLGVAQQRGRVGGVLEPRLLPLGARLVDENRRLALETVLAEDLADHPSNSVASVPARGLPTSPACSSAQTLRSSKASGYGGPSFSAA